MLFQLLVALFLVGAFVGIRIWQVKSSLSVFKGDQVSFSYPKDYQEQAKQPPQKHAASLIKLGLQEPLSIIELNKETGAIIGANITKTPFLDYLENSSQRGLKLAYKNYQQVESGRIKVSGRDVGFTRFSYTGRDNETTLYMSFFIIPAGNDAYYLYIQSVDEGRQKTDAKTIRRSLKLF